METARNIGVAKIDSVADELVEELRSALRVLNHPAKRRRETEDPKKD